jgi:hypothetical protein
MELSSRQNRKRTGEKELSAGISRISTDLDREWNGKNRKSSEKI